LINDGGKVLLANYSSELGDNIYPDSSSYPISSPDANEGGYLKVAQIYALIGDFAKAKAALQKAEAYADQLTAPYPRGKHYSLLGYYYFTVANDTAASEAAYAKAAAELANITQDDTKLKYNILLALNTFYCTTLAEDAKKTLVNGYLQDAVTLAENIFTDGTYYDNDEKDAAAEDTIGLLFTIADRYASINDRDKIRATLEKAESIIGDGITLPATALAQKKLVYNVYAKLYSVDLAVRKAETLANPTEINDALKIIATSIANTNAFPGTGYIAFSDTDKDGKPDFFVPWATAEQIAASGLELDDDIDGDGKPDTADLTPFYAD
jgi:tetratricopeptide (TPR) repeat protein